MKIAVAQTSPVKGNIVANIKAHKALIQLATSQKADCIFFPELSITGYEPALAAELATTQADSIFDEFQKMSDERKICIGVGMPTPAEEAVKISMIIFQPGTDRITYSKQMLHSDEWPFFVGGDQQSIIEIGHTKIAPAICYESLQMEHADKAIALGARLYVCSVAKTQGGIDKGFTHYPAIAKKYAMPVLMANSVGYSDDFLSAGQSAVWKKDGTLAGKLGSEEEGLLVFDTESEVVIKMNAVPERS